MGKDIEWLRNKLVYLHELDMWNWNQCEPNSREQSHFDGCLAAYEKALDFLDKLDEPEVLSQEWIDEHVGYADIRGGTRAFILVKDLQNLLIPDQVLPVIPQFVAEWIKEMKQDERPLYSAMSSLMNKTNHEWAIWKTTNKNFSEIVAQAWLDGYTVEEEPLYYALIKGHELTDSSFRYWNFDVLDNYLFVSNRVFKHGRYFTKTSKSEWNELGINDSNADFLKVEELEE